jgi:hypothetical protein
MTVETEDFDRGAFSGPAGHTCNPLQLCGHNGTMLVRIARRRGTMESVDKGLNERKKHAPVFILAVRTMPVSILNS